MKRKQLLTVIIICSALFWLTFSGCGSSDPSGPGLVYEVIESEEGAVLRRDDILNNNVLVIDTENSSVTCDIEGEDCYKFATRYNKVGSQTSVAVIDSSGHRIFFVFSSELRSNTAYEYFSGIDFLDQDVKMLVSYDSPEVSCREGCGNVYNWSDTVSCGAVSTSKYYKISVVENSDDYLEFVFRIWNLCFLSTAEVPDGDRSAVFQGHVKVKKSYHSGSETYYHRGDE